MLRTHRLAAGLTQADLASRAGLTARRIRDLELGAVVPRRATAARLAETLGLGPAEREALLAAAWTHRSRRRQRLEAVPGPASPIVVATDAGGRVRHRPFPRLAHGPSSLSTFIGREPHVEQVRTLLQSRRLVVLTGVGGCGKTRLALEVAAGLHDRFADGVCVVSLAPLDNPRLVEAAVAHALDLRERPGQPLRATLEVVLRDRELLLVLDNFEHLLDAAPLVADWLTCCPGLTVMATSREPLRLPGEQIYPVPPLTLPALSTEADTSEAVRLFVARAASVRSGFRLTEENRPSVVEICRRLDGLPLAIELAASWVRTLSPAQIAARLDDSFRLLVRGTRVAPPRHRTLRATLDWSHALLSEEEQTLLRRLSVFAGGWTLEAAEAVCASGEAPDVLALLSLLVDKSLVTVEERGGRVRYRLLEVIRQYGAARLTAAGEAAHLRRRHAAWAVALAERAWPKLWGPGQVAWLERLDVEHDNLRTALTWSEEAGEVETGLTLGWLLWRFWDQRGHYGEARERLTRLLAVEAEPSATRALALDAAGMLAFFQGDLDPARAWLEAGLALGRALDHPHSIAVALVFLGAVLAHQGELGRSGALLDESGALLAAVDDEPTRFVLDCTRRYFAGTVALFRRDGDQAESLLAAGLAQAQERGDRSLASYFFTMLASIALERGERERAATLQRECLAMAYTVQNRLPVAFALDGLACIAAAEGSATQAARLFGAAAGVWESLAASTLPRFRADNERGGTLARRQIGDAAFEAAWAEGRELPLEQAVQQALVVPHPGTKGASRATRPAVAPSSLPLLPREREIVVLVAQGRTSREIAERLALSKRTVDWYVARLLDRLGLHSRVQLAAWAGRQRVDSEAPGEATGSRDR